MRLECQLNEVSYQERIGSIHNDPRLLIQEEFFTTPNEGLRTDAVRKCPANQILIRVRLTPLLLSTSH